MVGVHGVVGMEVIGREASKEMLMHWARASMEEKEARKDGKEKGKEE